MKIPEIERVAEAHFYLRHVLENGLNYPLTDVGRANLGNHDSFLEYWRSSFGDRFFDMTTFIRLGSAFESGLRNFHHSHGGVEKRGLYQRIVSDDGLEELVKAIRADCGYNLGTNDQLPIMREMMVNRHLYAHRSGLIDEQYLNDYAALTGQDLRPNLRALGYPDQQVYWFKPLRQLSEFIEGAREFFRSLP